MADRSSQLRLLVACQRCRAQFDASAYRAGDRFHCSCGETIRVPPAEPHESRVVRCSACAAPRQDGNATACAFCGSGFTLHERDLHTLCPACMTRISDSARFCHACAQPIAPQTAAGEPTAQSCPACGETDHLTSRALGGAGLTLLECPRCAGLWVSNRIFEELAKSARSASQPLPTSLLTAPAETARQSGPLYRPCPVCGDLMHRRNYGRKSGVIVDTCGKDGIWFDLGELEQILVWVRDGGLARAEATAAEPRRRTAPGLDTAVLEVERGRTWALEFVERLVKYLLD